MTCESRPERYEDDTAESQIDPDFRFSRSAYDHLMGSIATGMSVPKLKEFLEAHKPAELESEAPFTPHAE